MLKNEDILKNDLPSFFAVSDIKEEDLLNLSNTTSTKLSCEGAKIFLKQSNAAQVATSEGIEPEILDNYLKKRAEELAGEKVKYTKAELKAGEKFARVSGIDYKVNTLYNDENAPIMMNIKSRKSETQRYYKEISLDEIRSRVSEPKWWYATRAMCAFVLVVAEEIGAKYIIPTDISLAQGLINN